MAGGGGPVATDDYWFSPYQGMLSAAGQYVNEQSSIQAPAVFACVRYCSETLASLPLILYRRRSSGGRERATDHPLYSILHNSPNPWQTSFEFIEMMQVHIELRGNAYAVIESGPGEAISALVPIHPDYVTVYRLPNGRLRYEVRSPQGGAPESYMQEEMLHIRGLSSNGVLGMSPISYARETFGAALGQQDYANRFIANDSKPNWSLEHPGKIGPEASARLKTEIQENLTGKNRGKPMLLQEGMKASTLGMTNRDSQFIEARKFTLRDVARIFRVPPHKIGDLEDATFSNIEQQAIEAVVDCIRPRGVRWEARLSMDLIEPLEIGEPGEYYAEFQLDGLLRGDIVSRYTAYGIGIQWGFTCPNRIAQKENEEPIPNGDEFIRPMNMVPLGTPAPDPNALAPTNPDDNKAQASLLKNYAMSAAERVVRKEVAAIGKLMKRADDDKDAFLAEAKAFYAQHAPFVAETMHITSQEALSYCGENYHAFTNGRKPEAALQMIESQRPEQLASLGLRRSLN